MRYLDTSTTTNTRRTRRQPKQCRPADTTVFHEDAKARDETALQQQALKRKQRDEVGEIVGEAPTYTYPYKDEDLDEDEDGDLSKPKTKRRVLGQQARVKNASSSARMFVDDSEEDEVPPREQYGFPFCCAHCVCSMQRKLYFAGLVSELESDGKKKKPSNSIAFSSATHRNTVSPDNISEHDLNEKLSFATDNDSPYHRHCCHGITKKELAQTDGDAFLLPIQLATEELLMMDGESKEEETQPLSLKDLRTILQSQHADVSKLHNDDTLESPMTRLLTSPDYCSMMGDYNKTTPKRRLRVLELFAGIGTASSVVLERRLQLDMQLVVHVEIDPVAMYVIQYHSDKKLRNEMNETSNETTSAAGTNATGNETAGRRVKQEDADTTTTTTTHQHTQQYQQANIKQEQDTQYAPTKHVYIDTFEEIYGMNGDGIAQFHKKYGGEF